MKRMKTFLMYLILLIAFYVFSNLMINAFLKVSYYDMHNYEINVDNLFVDVSEAKASRRNGHIYGIIKNNGYITIENKYLKVSLLSKNGVTMGEKYIKIDKIEPEQLRKFELNFDEDNVKTFKIEMVDTKPEEEDFSELIKTNAKDLINQTKTK